MFLACTKISVRSIAVNAASVRAVSSLRGFMRSPSSTMRLTLRAAQGEHPAERRIAMAEELVDKLRVDSSNQVRGIS